MKSIKAQLSFDGRRLVLRNLSFLFFSLLMPAGFYLFFTRVLISGTVTEMKAFNLSYMGSMIVYSGLISAIFSMALILKHDRDQGLVTLLKWTPNGLIPYYISLVIWSMVMSTMAVIVIGSVATLINGIVLSAGQWLNIMGISLIGQVPLLIIGAMMSHIQHNETLSLISNVVTFPMAMVSGLWWPINLLPHWLQGVGKIMPTYFSNQLIGETVSGGKIDTSLIMGIGMWGLGLLLIWLLSTKKVQKWSVNLGDA